MSNKEALLAILKEHPASWHLLRKTPEGWDYRHEGEEHFPRLWAKAGRESYKATRRNVPAKVGEIFVPTPARIDALEEWARGWVSDVAPKIGVSLDWIHGDLFSPPSIEAASVSAAKMTSIFFIFDNIDWLIGSSRPTYESELDKYISKPVNYPIRDSNRRL